MSGRAGTLRELAHLNPMKLLLRAPANYVGELDLERGDALRAATWYDPATERLVYRVGRYARFEPGDGPRDRIELAVALAFENRHAGVAAGGPRFEGVQLAALHAYRWPD